jgi:hypothetical protein
VLGQVSQIERVRAAACLWIQAILQNTTPGAERSAAIKAARESMMWANASIAVPRRQLPR